jgi:hypothetical protein
MAAIDKTYLNNWEQFDAARNWAKETYIPLKNGKKVCMADFMYEPYLEKEDWDKWHDEKIKSITEEYNKNPEEFTRQHKVWYGGDWVFNPEDYFEVVLWNTPTYADVFLIRNCPFDFIHKRLKEQYGEEEYEQIKNGTSVYDTYQRNGLGRNAKVKFSKHAFSYLPRDKKCWWWIEIIDSGWWYNEDDDMWYNHYELMPTTCNVNDRIHGALTKKNIVNMIRRWDLPKGIKLRFSCRLKGYGSWEFAATVK